MGQAQAHMYRMQPQCRKFANDYYMTLVAAQWQKVSALCHVQLFTCMPVVVIVVTASTHSHTHEITGPSKAQRPAYSFACLKATIACIFPQSKFATNQKQAISPQLPHPHCLRPLAANFCKV